jgi:hypothetical protein
MIAAGDFGSQEISRIGIRFLRGACEVNESRFYWWRRRPREKAERTMRKQDPDRNHPRFALISDQPGVLEASIELVLGGGRRLRISEGVDEETLRAALSAGGSQRC